MIFKGKAAKLLIFFGVVFLILGLSKVLYGNAVNTINAKVKALEFFNFAATKMASFREPPKLAIVIDDLGSNGEGTKELFELKLPLTVAIMPFMEKSTEESRLAHEAGYEVIIHLSLEANKAKKHWYAPNSILTSMDDESIKRILSEAKESVPHATGLNNHMGSKATGNERIVRLIAAEALRNNWYFLDSLTSKKTQIQIISSEFGIRHAKRDIFLDNVRSYTQIRKQILQAAQIAKANGLAIAIGHVGAQGGKPTISAIKDSLEEINHMGVQLAFLSEVIPMFKQRPMGMPKEN